MKVLDDLLGYQNLKIYQDDRFFKFSMDGVVLANFIKFRFTDQKILDIGTGTGVIPLILSTKTNKKIDAIEIQEDLCDLFLETIKYNHLEDQITLIHDDIKNYAMMRCHLNEYDIIISNPPYYKGKKNKVKQKLIARNQESLELEDFILCSKRLLKDHGSLFLVYDVNQLEYLIELFRKHHFCIKEIQFVHDTLESMASVFLVHAIKNGNYGMKILSPFILYDEKRNKAKKYQSLFSEK